jgi:hypothetical protein
MQKIILLICYIFLFTGCAGSYHANENKELNETEKQQRFKDLELAIQKIKVGDPVTLLLYKGDTVEGTFYSYTDGIVSVRIGDAFRDTELAEVQGIDHRSKDRMKKIMIGLMFAVVAGILAEFVATH